MSELFQLTCPRCGGNLGEVNAKYICNSCEKAFKETKVLSIADELRAVLNEQKQELVANLRRQLWAEMHEKYINSEKTVTLAREIKKYLPEDYFACFCELANGGSDKQINDFLNNTTPEQMADFADTVLDFMLKSLKPNNLTAVSLFIERAFKGDTQSFDKYATAFQAEAERVESGVYELTLPRDVFLAYSSRDIAQVIELCDYLESQKITCFLALRNLRHGRGAVDNYDQALRTAIDNCKTVVFVSSTFSRSLSCDALTKELPYIRQKDLEHAPTEFKRAYSKLPPEYMLPRVEYLIEDYCEDVAETVVKEFFHGLEWCKNKRDVAKRITDYLTAELSETARQRAEREKREEQQKNRELQQKLEEMRLKAAEESRRAEELRLKIEHRGVKGDSVENKEGKYCKKCKTLNPLNVKFCGNCGSNAFFANYDEYLESTVQYCKSCGAKNSTEVKFCLECGKSQFVPTYAEYTAYQNKLKEEAERKAREAEEARILKERLAEEAARKAEEERKLKSFNIKNGVVTKYTGEAKKVVIPDGVTAIGIHAFSRGNLTRVRIPEGVTEIRYCAFNECDYLKKITIPTTLTKIGARAFDKCFGLAVHISDIKAWCEVDIGYNSKPLNGGELYLNDEKVTEVLIPNTINQTGSRTFIGCVSISRVIFSEGIEKTNFEMFSNCANLVSVALPNSLKVISGSTFSGCRNLKSITIPEGVTEIGVQAFQLCSSLECIVIPESVTHIGEGVFDHCNIETIYCEAKKPLFGLPKGWHKDWLGDGEKKCKAKIIWNYKG